MQLQAKVVRYNVQLVKLTRSLVPLAIIATIGARYIGAYYVAAIALSAQGTLIYLFLRARAGLGTQAIVAGSDRLILVTTNTVIRRRSTIGWTLSDRLARVYGPAYSYKLVVAEGDANELAAVLTRAFGPVIATVRRGSPRARALALAGLVTGLVAIGAGLFFELAALALVGIVLAILGGATLGALSQRVAR